MKILDTVRAYIDWAFNYLDSMICQLVKTSLAPLLSRVVSISMIASVAIVIFGAILKSSGVISSVLSCIYAICYIVLLYFIVKELMPNIAIIKSVKMKALYVVVNLGIVFILGLLAPFLIQVVIVLAIVYFILSVLEGRKSRG
ncbi:MAG: hypothetical protein SNH35_04235 [Rikenellaceae bacterium]